MVKELIQARRPHPCSHCSFCRMSNAVSVLDLCFGLNATLLDTGSWLCFDERVSSSVDVRYWRTVGRSGCNYMYITKYLDLLPSEASQVGIFVEGNTSLFPKYQACVVIVVLEDSFRWILIHSFF